MKTSCIQRPNSPTLPPFGGVPPDARLVVRSAGGETLSRCSLWWRGTPRVRGATVGLIGHYAARDAESAARLLAQACTRLAERGHALAVGPVDGSTWMRYRFVVERGRAPPFVFEPVNPPEWPAQFADAGFRVLALYRSRVQENLVWESAPLARADARLHGIGVRIRGLDTRCMTRELQRFHALSLECFSDALLFSPISLDTFVARYRLLMPYIDPRLVLLAEHEERLVGYLFALPDAPHPMRGARARTVILKTIAVAPARRYAGLGHVLARHAAARARTLGYTRAIHALMREGAGSSNWSARLGRPMRRYAVFARTLDDLH